MSYPAYADLTEVNDAVNALPYKADPADFDDWSPISPAGGDCDSYAVGKLHRLLGLDWPIERLRLACCYVETGEYHAVLVVDTPAHGQVVLDNRQQLPQTLTNLHALGYIPDRIQQTGGSRTWVSWDWVSLQ